MKILIVEDEPMAAQRLQTMVEAVVDNAEIVAKLESVQDTADYLSKDVSLDVILMDVQLADGISFEVFDMISVDAPVIFTTAYDEFAVDAFRVHAMDYLLKPVKQNELKLALERCQDLVVKQNMTVQTALDHPKKAEKVLIKMGQRLKVLELAQASYYHSENKITFFIHPDGKRYVVDFSLDALESKLSTSAFFRINRQFIINRAYIENMTSYSANRIKLDMSPSCAEDVIVSKDKVSRFRKWLIE